MGHWRDYCRGSYGRATGGIICRGSYGRATGGIICRGSYGPELRRGYWRRIFCIQTNKFSPISMLLADHQYSFDRIVLILQDHRIRSRSHLG